jgi:plastocyanin
MRKPFLTTVIGTFALFLSNCGGTKTDVQSDAAGAPPPAKVDPASAGTITGKVNFIGEKPVRRPISMDATPACARIHTQPVLTEDVIVNDNGTLRNVFVYIKAGLPEASWPVPAEPAKLDQVGCVYTPHVLGVMVGQDLMILNSDATNHNVHPLPRTNREWNLSQPPKGDAIIRQFNKPEIMIPFKCNVHPWMKAFIGVTAHPFFAVSGEEGTFTIKDVPPGDYTLEAWHERYGTQEIQVTVNPSGTATTDFTFQG